MKVYELKKIANNFREAIKQSESMDGFPIGCCKRVSILLAKYFIEYLGVDESEIKYVEATGDGNYENGNMPSKHIWLNVGNINIDITADQYKEVTEEVIVTEDWIWGDKFIRREEIEYNNPSISYSESLRPEYDAIIGIFSIQDIA